MVGSSHCPTFLRFVVRQALRPSFGFITRCGAGAITGYDRIEEVYIENQLLTLTDKLQTRAVHEMSVDYECAT